MRTIFPLFLILSILAGCSSMNTVKAWDKDILAKPEMALVDNKIEEYLDGHIYFSKEGSVGGQGMGGGGCGCN